MILVNGGEGIGTGWSTNIPTYDPVKIIENLKRLLKNEELVPLHPWYRGFTGEVEESGSGKYKITGAWQKLGSNKIEITELPIGTWTQPYKEFLEGLLIGSEKTPPSIKVS